jgi:hypothetical protein
MEVHVFAAVLVLHQVDRNIAVRQERLDHLVEQFAGALIGFLRPGEDIAVDVLQRAGGLHELTLGLDHGNALSLREGSMRTRLSPSRRILSSCSSFLILELLRGKSVFKPAHSGQG